MCQRKNYENRSIFSEDMDKSIVSPFFDSRCISGSEHVVYTVCDLGPEYSAAVWNETT